MIMAARVQRRLDRGGRDGSARGEADEAAEAPTGGRED